MCTAVNMTDTRLFGRTLDLERGYGEEIVITPKGFSFGNFQTKYPIIGVAAVSSNVPLYFDGMNGRGLCAAALNYPDFAIYSKPRSGKTNIPSYTILPYILGNCATVKDALDLLSEANVTDTPFSKELPPSPLHWIISDGSGSICAEPHRNGLSLHINPFNVLTNSPNFEYHSLRVCDHMSISPYAPENYICPDAELRNYSRGLGATGLPGDFSSSSRFIRALFSVNHTRVTADPVCDFFHIMDTVALPNGTVITEDGAEVRTVYTACADRNNMAYYFTTYECRRIRAVRLVDTKKLLRYSMKSGEDIDLLN